MKNHDLLIGERVVGPHSGVFFIAEIGLNHGGSLEQAIKLVDAAADAGADAVKFQTFRADQLLIPGPDRYSQQGGNGESAYKMFRRLELSWEHHEKLRTHAASRGVEFLSTPFDEESVEFLARLGLRAFKIASADITHSLLLRRVARLGKPVLLSTGMSLLSEVAEAVGTLRASGANDIVLLHCTSCYPAPAESLNLRALQTLQSHFDLPVGYSDHTEGMIYSIMAVALGAVVLEKHFTLDKSLPGPDHALSLDPGELNALISTLRKAERSLGNGRKHPVPEEVENRRLSRRSIVAAVDIRANEVIAPWMLSFKRPGTGLDPRLAEQVINSRARRDIGKNSILDWQDIHWLEPPRKPASIAENSFEEDSVDSFYLEGDRDA